MYVLFGVLASVASSTGIVLLNKLLFAHDDFTFPATLTGWHLLITHGVLSAAIRLNVFQSKRLARKYVVWFCVFDAAAMALQNLSLTYNTINFYQTCKLFTIPVTVIIERFAGQAFPKASKMVSLALITWRGSVYRSEFQHKYNRCLCGVRSDNWLRVSTCLDLLVAKVTRALLKSIVAQCSGYRWFATRRAGSISRLSFIASYFVQAL